MLHIYTDGSFNQASKRYAWSFVAMDRKTIIHQACGIGMHPEARKMQNVAGELSAVMHACVWAVQNGHAGFTIFHDYEGVANWLDAKKPWEAKNEMVKAYARFMLQFIDKVKFVHVKGHSGDTFNELADTIARGAFSHCDRLGVTQAEYN